MGDLAKQLPEDEDVVRKTRPKTRKRGFSDKLPRLQIHWRLSDEEKQGVTKTFFTKVKEELDIIPAQAREKPSLNRLVSSASSRQIAPCTRWVSVWQAHRYWLIF